MMRKSTFRTREMCISPLKRNFKPPPLCFVTKIIGEVARRDGGVEHDISSVCLYPFSPAVSRSITGCCVRNIGETPQKQPFLR